jgi:hypothetical protein|tara:strand:+ start:57 stop:335 length:279 start_codon:yes stop_codon:yes gene_type:complete
MRYFLGKSKELEIDKNKKHKFLIQKWNDPVDNGAGTGNVFYYLNILEWDKEKDGYESKYNLNILGENQFEFQDNTFVDFDDVSFTREENNNE